MCLRDRLISLIYRSVALPILLAVYIAVLLTYPLASDTFWVFSIESGALVIFALGVNLYHSAHDLKRTGRVGVTGSLNMPFSLAIIAFSFLGLISFFAEEKAVNLFYLIWLALLNVLAPLLYLLDYLLFQEKGSGRYSHPVYWSLYPAAYILIMVVKPYITGYDSLSGFRFFSPMNYMLEDSFLAGNGGYNGVAIAIAVSLAVYFVLAYLVVIFDRFLGQRFAKKDKKVY